MPTIFACFAMLSLRIDLPAAKWGDAKPHYEPEECQLDHPSCKKFILLRRPWQTHRTTTNPFCPRKCSTRRSDRITPRSFYPGNCIPFGSDKARSMKRTVQTLLQVMSPWFRLCSSNQKTRRKGRVNGYPRTIQLYTWWGAQINIYPKLYKLPVINRKLPSSRQLRLLTTGQAKAMEHHPNIH